MTSQLRDKIAHITSLLVWTTIFLLSDLQPVYAQLHAFKHLNVKDGLSQSSVLDIARDAQGLMWFATRYGLNRYDGVRFKIYENQPNDSTSICNNYINQIYSDSKKQLWIGTQGGLDLYSFENDGFEHFYFYENERKIHGISVLKIREDQKGNIWIGTNRGLYLLANGMKRCTKLPSTPQALRFDIIHELFVDGHNHLWGTSSSGILQLKYDNEKLSIIPTPSVIDDITGHVRTIVEDNEDNLWFGSETSGLYCLTLTTNNMRHFKSDGKQGLLHSSIRELLLNEDNQLIVATQDGVSILDLKTFNFTNYQNNPEDPTSLSQNSIYALYEDDQQSLWVGTYFGGVNLAYGIDTKFKRLHVNSSVKIPHNVIRPIAEDSKKNLWFGTEGGGVFFADPDFKNIKGFYNRDLGLLQSRSNFVKSILIDRADSIWVGTSGGGVYHLNPETGKYTQAFIEDNMNALRTTNVMSMYQDKAGKYWIFGEGYNKIFKRVGQKFEDVTPANIHTAFSNQNTVSILESSDNHLWILTSNALFEYNPHDGSLAKKLATRAPSAHAYNCILEDHRGQLWIGVDYEGLMHIDPKTDSVICRYSSSDGLASDNVVGLLEDRNKSLWITTTRGLSRLTGDRKRIQNYTSQDGIADDEFNYNSTFLSSNGTVLLGSLGGLTWFSPSSIQVNEKQPTVIFTGLTLFGDQAIGPAMNSDIIAKNITQRPHLTFDNTERVFTIQFALDNYIKSAQNRFMYRLEGTNVSWSTLEKAEVSFSNLAPGSYVLAVKGSNSDGIWSKQSKISFTVKPPIYLAWWAIVVYVSILCLLLFFFLRYLFLREILIKEEHLHQTKLNFFSMISHEIRSHLSLIIIPIENALEKVENNYARSQLENASKNSKRLLRLSSELIDFRKVETTILPLRFSCMDITPFITDIVDSFKLVYKDQGIDFNYESTFSTCLMEFDSLQLEKVLFNLLSNAVKHSHKGSTIKVKSKIENEYVVFCVSNQGKEIPKEYLEKIFEHFFQVSSADRSVGFGIGLALSKQIISMHAGDIFATSSGGHTTFTIVLPIKQTMEVPLNTATTDISDLKMPELDSMPAEKSVVLVIEDNMDLMVLMREVLSANYHVLTASNGAQGIIKAQEQLPDLIISDVMMPIKNGMQVCDELKMDVVTSHIPIILLTARNTENDVLEGLAHHADAYLTKPFDKRILLLQVRNLLRATQLLQQKYRQQYILEPTKAVINGTDERFLSQLVLIIEEGIETSKYSVDYLASEIGMSSSVLYKKVKTLTGMTVNDFSKTIRLKKAAQMLTEANNSVNHVANYVGFMDSKYFSREFKKQFGQSPSQYSL